MPDPPVPPSERGRGSFGLIPPAGFKATLYPLQHRVIYSAGLSAVTATKNSTMFILVRHYKTTVNPSAVFVNPHHASFDNETGSVCNNMSIIDRLKIILKFNITANAINVDSMNGLHVLWRPIFFSFPEKLDAADDETTTTVASLLSLTKDATQEDITPAFGTKLPVVGSSDLSHPISTVNIAPETKEILNLTTDLTMEAIPYNEDTLQKAFKNYTNKGALKACVGKTRHMFLSDNHELQTYFINKFVPRPIRRIVPYTFFAIQIHLPIISDVDQVYHHAAGTADVAHVGVKMVCTYDEWHPDHFQDMAS